jgi:hypothetical protein
MAKRLKLFSYKGLEQFLLSGILVLFWDAIAGLSLLNRGFPSVISTFLVQIV